MNSLKFYLITGIFRSNIPRDTRRATCFFESSLGIIPLHSMSLKQVTLPEHYQGEETIWGCEYQEGPEWRVIWGDYLWHNKAMVFVLEMSKLKLSDLDKMSIMTQLIAGSTETCLSLKSLLFLLTCLPIYYQYTSGTFPSHFPTSRHLLTSLETSNVAQILFTRLLLLL